MLSAVLIWHRQKDAEHARFQSTVISQLSNDAHQTKTQSAQKKKESRSFNRMFAWIVRRFIKADQAVYKERAVVVWFFQTRQDVIAKASIVSRF